MINRKNRIQSISVPLMFLACATVAQAKEHRSWEAKHHFEIATHHPHGWKGHVVDHIIPLACGGADSPSNMQWETIAEAKAKDRWERTQCRMIAGRHEGCCK